MELCEVIIAGYRRFAKETRLKTGGKLVAILGPNEAGKTSLLAAMEHLNSNQPPSSGELSRSDDALPFSISGRYFLDEKEVSDARLSGGSWLIVKKGVDGVRHYSLEPPASPRDLRARHRVADTLQTMRRNTKFLAKLEDSDVDLDDFDVLVEALEGKTETLSPETLASAEAIGAQLRSIVDERDIKRIQALGKDLKEFLALERSPTPKDFAIGVLKDSIPRFIRFDHDARNLLSSYALEEIQSEIPLALDNLCDAADIEGKQLVKAGIDGNLNGLATIEGQANRRLTELFAEAWQQSDVKVSIRVQDGQLVIQAVDESQQYTSFDERSDGLRQFVALQAFASANWKGEPILLIDEAEQRLHYDAQADLVQMLARQTVAPKVIFTTHSAGCLPEDLGNGVRLVSPNSENPSTSSIQNKFWADDSRGLMPLLFGMGASTLAYFPTRRAVMVEGISDMLLLPTMFKHALQLSTLGFQFVPGLAENGNDETGFQPPVIGAGHGVLFLVDGDNAGKKSKAALEKRRVSDKDIFSLSLRRFDTCEVEDFIAPILLIQAAEAYRQKFYPQSQSLLGLRLPAEKRMAGLESAFKKATANKLPKVDLAYEVLDRINENPALQILDSARANAFRTTARAIVDRLSAIADEKSSGKL